jgi:hypothetical protein
VNYTPAPPLPTEHRLARLQTWLALTIAWFAAHVLALVAPNAAANELARLGRWTRLLIIVRALKRTSLPRTSNRPRCYDNHSRVRRLTDRRMAGAGLRRALKARSPQARARALYAALTYADAWIARLARRFTRRFTKLRRVRHRALTAPALCAACAMRDFADTS